MIEIKNLSLEIGGKRNFALKNINIKIEKSITLAILGPSGSGKTLLMESILEIRKNVKGDIRIDGTYSYVPQDLALFPHLSVKENILFGLNVRHEISIAEKELRLCEIAKLLNVENLLTENKIENLSGGEKQRVALARALIMKPDILFLDEPLTALDLNLARELQDLFVKLKNTLSLTVIHITHNHDEAFILGDKIAVIMNGEIVQIDKPEVLRDRPASEEIAKFLMVRNIIPAEFISCKDDFFEMNHFGIKLLCKSSDAQTFEKIRNSKNIKLVIRPGNIRLQSHVYAESELIVKQNVIKVNILSFIKLPSEYIVYLEIPESKCKLEMTISSCAFSENKIAEKAAAGKQIYVFLNSDFLWPVC